MEEMLADILDNASRFTVIIDGVEFIEFEKLKEVMRNHKSEM